MTEKFGLYAENLLCRASFDMAEYGKIAKVPSSVGFKQKDGTWVNEYFDVIAFERNKNLVQGILKGDKFKVSGRVNLSEWTNTSGEKKKSWSILLDEIEMVSKSGQDTPF